MVRERGQKVVATNCKARNDYQILDVFEAGLVLTGTEVKTLREGRASLVDGHASIDGGRGLFLVLERPHHCVFPGLLDKSLNPPQAQTSLEPH